MNSDHDRAERPKAEVSGSADTPSTARDEALALARHRDPSLTKKAAKQTGKKPEHGVAWVRPSELMTQAGGRAAGRGIDFHAELARRARRLPGQVVAVTRQAMSTRARRLPPVTDFGTQVRSNPATTRPGIGLR